MINRKFSIAPMMDYTDRHFRYLARLMTKHSLLYTEMVNTYPILDKNKRHQVLDYNLQEHPLALQVGGSDPSLLAECARIAEDYGYDEINLNAGCPSDRVQQGKFGACLMKEPLLVARCIEAMRAAVKIPVTLKIRIGVDEFDSYSYLQDFVRQVAAAGCDVFIVHARKAWLKGLSPKENRTVPPLHYDTVYQLKRDFPRSSFVINGGIKTLAEAHSHLQFVDGVMLGREAYHNSYLLAEVDGQFYGDNSAVLARSEILMKFLPYLQQQFAQGVPLRHSLRHLLGLVQGMKGARLWRQYVSEGINNKIALTEIMQKAYCQLIEV